MSGEVRGKIKARRLQLGSKSWLHWYLQIVLDGEVIYADDCRDLPKLMAQAQRKVEDYRYLVDHGFTVLPWSKLVEAAEI